MKIFRSILGVLLIFWIGLGCFGGAAVVAESLVNFDYLILRQIWTPATCMYPGPNTCSIDHNITSWVVHGLW